MGAGRRRGAKCARRRTVRDAAVVLLCAVLHYEAQALRVDEVEPLIGWQGDTFHPQRTQVKPATERDDKRPWVQILSWKPRAAIYHNFLSDAEAAHIIKAAAPLMKRSTVLGANNQGVVNHIRTSAGTFLRRNQNEVIKAVEQRLAVWTGIPVSHQEDLQVLRYGPTNKYGPHCDGLERLATVLIYLVAPEEGGETAFPMSDAWTHPDIGEPTQGKFSECAKGHVAYKPKRGDALLFWDMMPDGKSEDPSSMHTGCPVLKGIKWNAVKWIHSKPFREDQWNKSLSTPHKPEPDPGMCINRHESCEMWAQSGECKRNPGFMLGDNAGQGMCRLACQECIPCKSETDTECITKNREKGGYLNFDKAELKLAEMGVQERVLNF